MRDDRNVGPQRKRNPQSRGRAISPVVLQQTLAHVAGRDPDDRIFTCIVGGCSAEQLHSDYPLFETLQMPFNCLFHHMAEKLRAAMTSLEGGPFCNFREVFPDG